MLRATDCHLGSKPDADVLTHLLDAALQIRLRWHVVTWPDSQELAEYPGSVAATLGQHLKAFVERGVADEAHGPEVIDGSLDTARMLGSGKEKHGQRWRRDRDTTHLHEKTRQQQTLIMDHGSSRRIDDLRARG